jgi:shikimate kinase
MKVLLTGFMGTGKTTVGRRLAERLERPFFDLDSVVEEMVGVSVREIFDTQGEEAFRKLEKVALQSLLETEGAIVATGGGTLTREENIALVRGRGLTVWLDAPLEVIEGRLDRRMKQERPLFASLAEMRALFTDRQPAYRQADMRIEIDGGDSVEQIVSRLIGILEEVECATS